MKRAYSNDRITVYWDSAKCVHAGLCYGQLPQVFRPSRRPWVDLGAADAEAIARVVDTCPSGALTCKMSGQESPKTPVVRVMKNGPYSVTGPCCLIDESGNVIETGETFSLCRCGRSKKMPFCDGSHLRKAKKKPLLE